MRGFAVGLAAHGIGTARAFQVSEVAVLCSAGNGTRWRGDGSAGPANRRLDRCPLSMAERDAYRLARTLAFVYALLIVYASLHPLAGWRIAGTPMLDFLGAPWPRYVHALRPDGQRFGIPAAGVSAGARAGNAAQARLGGPGVFAFGAALSLAMEVLQGLLPHARSIERRLGLQHDRHPAGALAGARWGRDLRRPRLAVALAPPPHRARQARRPRSDPDGCLAADPVVAGGRLSRHRRSAFVAGVADAARLFGAWVPRHRDGDRRLRRTGSRLDRLAKPARAIALAARAVDHAGDRRAQPVRSFVHR